VPIVVQALLAPRPQFAKGLSWLGFVLVLLPVLPGEWMKGKSRVSMVAAGLLLLFLLLRLVVETPALEIEHRLTKMSQAVKAKNLEGVMKHFAGDFKHGPDLNKGAVEGHLRNALETEDLQEVVIWDIKVEIPRPEEGVKPKGIATFQCKAKGKYADTLTWDCKVIFERQANGEWLLKDFETPRDHITNEVVPIPGIGL
jgi:hypothetical protein